MNIEVGDLITLKGFKNKDERPIGLVLSIKNKSRTKIMWLNEEQSARFALKKIININKLEPISKAT